MKIALIIPAYKPGKELLELLAQFEGNDEFVPVVVDDGGGKDYEPIFAALPEGVVLLRHEANRGKGAALKTAMKYVLESLPECTMAITADADGQHRYQDILCVAERAKQNPNALVLGSRAFTGEVPLRSRFGNSITRQVFAAATGAKVYDTQTGLRAISRSAMERFINVPGDRYEYEINMLLDAAQNGIPIVEEKIETVYLNENQSSHFNAFRDSLKIYMCIIKFGFSSLLAFCVDYVVFLLLSALTRGMDPAVGLAISEVGARIVSASVNFCVNRAVVFKGNETFKRALLKYALLACGVLIVNYLLMHLLTIGLGVPSALAKIIVEVALFFVNFVVQGRFVYRGNTLEEK